MSVTRLKANCDKFTLYAVCNSRGDVEELRKESGSLYARYVYDSWGNVLHIYSGTGTTEITDTANLAIQNPFRYRGYYYDTESGLYYLQSRYYDPVTGRFVNADGQISGVGGDVLGYNLYAYCQNNPVNNSDSEGGWPNWSQLVSGALTAITGMMAVSAVVTATTCAAPVIVAATIVAGVATMVFGAAEMTEAITDSNPLKETVFNGNEQAYNTTKMVTGIVASAGASNVVTSTCFVAGTLISYFNGRKNIEDIKVGDEVWATNPETGETELKEVVQTFINETDELVYVYADGEEIVTTPEHPFYVSNHGWIGAIDLRAGDKLVLVNGEFAVVENVQHEILEQPIKVYNFEVEDFHTYYVGNTGVLVHNSCQNHHFLSNKNKTYTPKFREITDKYDLNLNKGWNIEAMEGHVGRHTNSYHEFMLDSVKGIDSVANGSTEKFISLFNGLKDYVISNPGVMYGKK